MSRRATTAVSTGPSLPRSATTGSRRVEPVRRKPRRSLLGRLLGIGLILTIWGLVVVAVIVIWAARDLPRPESAMDAERRPAFRRATSARTNFYKLTSVKPI